MGEILPIGCVEALVRVVNDELVFVEPRMGCISKAAALQMRIASRCVR